MNDLRSPSLDPVGNTLTDLTTKLKSGTETAQMQAIAELVSYGEEATDALIDFLLQRRSETRQITYVDGKAYLALQQINTAKILDFFQNHYPHGLVPLSSEASVDYASLQELLVQQDFQAADRLTTLKMCEISGSEAVARGWLYFTDVKRIPKADLNTINDLWVIYSEGKFGYSVQRKIWLSLGKTWEKFWLQIGWKKEGKFTRYPDEFIWNITAPKGHLPLSNQIRGNKTIAAIFAHPLWS